MASPTKAANVPNRDATRQVMRTFVVAQCHVEYYCGPKTTLFFPWNNGLKVEQIEAYYDSYKFPPEAGQTEGHRFYDWKHAETGAELLKAQHPEFEMYSQGVHAKAGVACADCHMPYERQGAARVSEYCAGVPAVPQYFGRGDQGAGGVDPSAECGVDGARRGGAGGHD